MEFLFILLFCLILFINYYYIILFLIFCYFRKTIFTRKLQLRLYLSNFIIHNIVDYLYIIELKYKKLKKHLIKKILKFLVHQIMILSSNNNDSNGQKEKIKSLLKVN